MQFDPNNKIVQLCAKGMELEAKHPEEARALFLQAWNESTNDFEKFTTAHYVARHQTSVEDKLNWDKIALEFALKADDDNIAASYPSLYLNIAKCYEDLKDFDNARKNYQTALSYANNLPDDGYGQLIKSGIKNGIERLSEL
jgi:rifampin ADP-ribosylating transferase